MTRKNTLSAGFTAKPCADAMNRKRFIKLVMAHRINKYNAEAAARVARTTYRSYDNAYQHMHFRWRGFMFCLPTVKKYEMPRIVSIELVPNSEYRMSLRYAAAPVRPVNQALYLKGEWGTNHE